MGLANYVQLAFDFFSAGSRETQERKPLVGANSHDLPNRAVRAERAERPERPERPARPAPPTTDRIKVPPPPTSSTDRLEYVHPLANRVLEWPQARIHYQLKRGARRTIGMMVSTKGLEVAAPKWVSVAQILEALTEKQDWILRQLLSMHQRAKELSAYRLPLSSPLILPLLGLPMEVVLSAQATKDPAPLPQPRARGNPSARARQDLSRIGAQLMHWEHGVWRECLPNHLVESLQGKSVEAGGAFEATASLTSGTSWTSRTSRALETSGDTVEVGTTTVSDLPDLPDVSNISQTSKSYPSSSMTVRSFLRLMVAWPGTQLGPETLIETLSDADKVRLADFVLAWMSSWVMDVITMRVEHFAPVLGVTWSRIKLSRSATRWGSANARGELSFNRHLAHVNLALLDYVVVHELSHFKHMNHSPAFWGVVKGVMPDYDVRRTRLQKTPMPDWQAWEALREKHAP